jgi:hypothetical protein
LSIGSALTSLSIGVALTCLSIGVGVDFACGFCEARCRARAARQLSSRMRVGV